MDRHYKNAELSPYNNLWWNIHDFTPCSEGPNWSLLGECYKTEDFLTINGENQEKFQNLNLKFDNQSLVPLTIGSRKRDLQSDNLTLVMIFKDDLQDERAFKMVSDMNTHQPDQIELVRSRELILDSCDVDRLFPGNSIISHYSTKGPIIALQVIYKKGMMLG